MTKHAEPQGEIEPCADAIEMRAQFLYAPDTGTLTWRYGRGGVPAGSTAGTMNPGGYMRVRAFGKFHQLHRICWLVYYGRWPTGLVDHINGVTWDNRLSNLREVTAAQNQWNRVKPKGGVFWHSKNKRWTVNIRANNKLHHFGSFASKEEAEAKAAMAIKELHGEFARN